MPVATLKAVFKATTAGFEAGVKRVNKGLEKARQKTDQTKGSMDSLGGTMGKLAAGLGLSVGLGIIAQKFFATNVEVEKLKASLVTITGSVSAAEGAFANLMDVASTTPFQLEEVTSSFIKMKAQGLNPTQDAMKDFGNIAAAMGKSLDAVTEGILDAVQGEWERMKEFGMKAKQEGDRIKIRFGGVTTEIGNNAAEIQAYLRTLAKENFGDAMERQMATMSGAMSNLGDNVTRLFVALGEAGINEFIGDMIRSVSEVIGSLAAWESGLTALGGAITTLIPLMGGAVAGLVAFKVTTIATTTSVFSLVAALIAMKGALIATGIGALVVGLGMLLPKLWNWITATDKQAEAAKKQAAELKKTREETKRLTEEAKKQAEATRIQIKLDNLLAQRKKDLTTSGIIDHYKDLRDEIETYTGAHDALNAMVEAGISINRHAGNEMFLGIGTTVKDINIALSDEAKALMEVEKQLKAVTAAAHAASAAGIAEGFETISKEVSAYQSAMEALNTKKKAGIPLTEIEASATENLRGKLSEGARALLEYMEAQARLNETRQTAVGWLAEENRKMKEMEENITIINEAHKIGIDVRQFLTEAQIKQLEAGEDLVVVYTQLQEELKKLNAELKQNQEETEETTDTWKEKWKEAWKDLRQTFGGILVYGVGRVLGGMVDMLFEANKQWSKLGTLLKDIGKQMLKMALNAAIMRLLTMLGGHVFGGGGVLGGIGKWFGFGQNAQGGLISEPTALIGMQTGRMGTMSERAPEYIVPISKMSGAGGGGGNISVTINVAGSVGVDNIASEIVGSLRRQGLG